MRRLLCVILTVSMLASQNTTTPLVGEDTEENGLQTEECVSANVDVDSDSMESAPVLVQNYSGAVRDAQASSSSSGLFSGAKSGDLSQLKPSQQEIASENAKVAYPSSSIERFSETPSSVSPYTVGTCTDEYLNTAGTYVNYIRYLAGVPSLSLNQNLNTAAQYGAVLLAANGVLSHAPSKPDDMSSDFYQKGYSAAGSSNIYSLKGGASGTAYMFKNSLDSYLNDNNSASNLLELGHRRWVLYPYNVRVGFGQADRLDTDGRIKSYTSMKVISSSLDRAADDPEDTSLIDSYEYDFISWPSSGNFPSNMMQRNVPWSVTLNPSVYAQPSASSIAITVTRTSDQETWSFSSADILSKPSASQKYMQVNTDYYGINNCIIFNMGSEFSGSAYDGVYEVEISGLKTKKGSSTTLTYKMDFFDITNPDDEDGEEDEYVLGPSSDVYLSENKVYHTVTFHPENDEENIVVTALDGQSLELPATPQKAGYVFQGWYLMENGSFTTPFTETTAITLDYDIYASYKEEQAVYQMQSTVITAIKNETYTGERILPEIIVKNGSTLLSENQDYLISYRDNTNAGTATVTLTGIGDYEGVKRTTFRILPRNISLADIWYEDQNATGRELTPKIHAMDLGNTLVAETDYHVSSIVGDLVKVGKKTITLTGKGNYTGTVKKTFQIYGYSESVISPDMISVQTTGDASFDTEKNCFIYNGAAIKPVITIKDKKGNTLDSKNYKLKYKNNKNAGMASVQITGKKAFVGSYTVYYTIAPYNLSATSVAPITSKIFTGSSIKPKTSVIAAVVQNGKQKSLKAKVKKDYRITYSSNLNTGTATVVMQGCKNFTGVRYAQFTITPKDIAKGISVKGLNGLVYMGEPVVPEEILLFKKLVLKEDQDYTIISIDNNTGVGKGEVSFEGTGNYTGTLKKTFTIK